MVSCNLQNFGLCLSQFREIQLFRETWRISLITMSRLAESFTFLDSIRLTVWPIAG